MRVLLLIAAAALALVLLAPSERHGNAQTYMLAPKHTYTPPAGLCFHGHQRKRLPDCRAGESPPGCLNYGGLRKKRGFQRDHFCSEQFCREDPGCDVAAADPLRPPGPDNPGNVWYQPYPDATAKDAEEDELGDHMCAGEITPEQSCAQLAKDWGSR